MNIDLSKYELVHPLSIKHVQKDIIMYDIIIKDNPSFYIYLNENIKVLMHNCDGHHIASLLVNLFHKWFPNIIEDGRLFKLVTPLVVCDDGKTRKYFQTLKEFEEFSKTRKLSGVIYLKGLGSLCIEDWQWVMTNKTLFQIIDDRSAKKFLEIAFGESSAKRKFWLQNGS
jgi:DNA gyrase/topoisomerase IV subunit B